eukprot:15438579-Alexandrium_andersonii.AAC.2
MQHSQQKAFSSCEASPFSVKATLLQSASMAPKQQTNKMSETLKMAKEWMSGLGDDSGGSGSSSSNNVEDWMGTAQ